LASGSIGRSGSLLPVSRRRGNAPDVRRAFKFHGNLKKLADGMRALDLSNARAHVAARLFGNFQRDPGILGKVML